MLIIIFLYYVFLSDLFFNQIKREMHGVNLPRVSPTKLGELIIPFPPLSEQSRIITRIRQLFTLF
ncbi:restriction endonuclease subunit S [Lactobacillus kefiranofaciens subsp. kefiranofaciens]|nr:restriction endonuclease subunit S [Lactobacillus kefiranofaciens subsp. kefiranofaciens]